MELEVLLSHLCSLITMILSCDPQAPLQGMRYLLGNSFIRIGQNTSKRNLKEREQFVLLSH